MAVLRAQAGMADARGKRGAGWERDQEQLYINMPPKEKKPATEEAPFVNTVPPGHKKDTTAALASAFNPIAVESSWDMWWRQSGYYTADAQSGKPAYVCCLPPPNVTGALHLGHALTVTLEDSIARWHRMRGFNVLWLPGQDHAGISCQVVVEKRLKKERGLSRHDLGREAFVAEVWKWKEEFGSKISSQTGRLGASLDYTREAFTMDQNLSAAVKECFVRFFSQNLIYRAKRLVNWDCTLKSAVSDIEVDTDQLEKPERRRVPGHGDRTYEFGVLIEFAYKVEGSDDEIVVATTRLETMLGDTAVAVHPEDPRYTHLHGKFLVHPFLDRRIPIICDAVLVDMAFGTGAVKVTPAHDANDFLTGQRHGLPMICVFNDDGSMTADCGQFAGLMRFECRRLMVEKMKEIGCYRDTKPNPGQKLPTSQRTGDVIEPMLKPQWWVASKDMATKAADAVRQGVMDIKPPIFKDTWYQWLDNIKDWCVSRQLWWGHRIPAWYVVFAGEGESVPLEENFDRWIVAGDEAEARQRALAKFPGEPNLKLVQDEDVLDTWFSSGLFPFSTLGWPNTEHPDFKAFYPNTILETGHDILFFWVARMVMMGITLTGQVPFKTVFLHAMVRDKEGRKMSKSLGNVIDPMWVLEGISLADMQATLENSNLDPREVEKAKKGMAEQFKTGIPQCGVDALRFGLAAYMIPGTRDINLDVLRVEGYRHFCNKIWNATKFALGNLGDSYVPPPVLPARADLTVIDRWILSRLNACIAKCNQAFASYDFEGATTAMYSFFLYDFCDIYLEATKGVFSSSADAPSSPAAVASARACLWLCLDQSLRLMHPLMPFVTEELWHHLPHLAGEVASLMIASYPVADPSRADVEAEAVVQHMMDSVRVARQMRDAYGLKPKDRPAMYVKCKVPEFERNVAQVLDTAKLLSNAGSFGILPVGSADPSGCGLRPIGAIGELHMHIKGLVDVDGELKRLEKQAGLVRASLEGLQKKMAAADYAVKVPERVQKENSEKAATLEEELTTIARGAELFKSLRE